MANDTSSPSSAAAAAKTPEKLPGTRILGFECCHCNGVSLTSTLGECHDDECSHHFCLGCTAIDKAGRLWDKQLALLVHWMCQCGSAHPVVSTLVVDETGKLARPVCSCQTPSFVALYNKYGRLCRDLGLSVDLPFAMGTAADVQALLAELEATSYGPCIQSERRAKKGSKKVEAHARDHINQAWANASKCWTEADSD